MALIGQVVLEKKMFEIVYDGQTDARSIRGWVGGRVARFGVGG